MRLRSTIPMLCLALAACGGADDGEADDETASESDALTATWITPPMRHDLQVVNAYRAKHGRAPLVLARRLSTFAHAGSVELRSNHVPHAHFLAAAKNGSIWNDGFRHLAGENQGDPNGWPAEDQTKQIDEILAEMYAEGPGKGEAHAHYENIENPKFTRLGVGFAKDASGKLYFTNDFSD
ncbi:MAG TPA: CAP domain-containing protein [Labilithrix sp.]|jgi:hypothetical protein